MALAKIVITQIGFLGGDVIDLSPDDTLILVGANNSGKSATLRSIGHWLSDAAPLPGVPVVTGVSFQKDGDFETLLAALEELSPPTERHLRITINNRHISVDRESLRTLWDNPKRGPLPVSDYFYNNITTELRLQAANNQSNRESASSPIINPLQEISSNFELQEQISEYFRKAFGTDLVISDVHQLISLHVGPRPAEPIGLKDLSRYLDDVRKLPPIVGQGDGMRAFTGILVSVFTGPQSIIAIDEPEAFLHPPQAYRLGHILGSEMVGTQKLIATHSSDILKGVLDGKTGPTKIARINRDRDDHNRISLLDDEGIRELWSNPILRYSNALDGLFHQLVVLCEADADCKLFHAVEEAVATTDRRPAKDILYTHCGGKHRMPVIVRALSKLGVPVRSVPDIDVLNEETVIRELVMAHGGDWVALRPLWLPVQTWVTGRDRAATAGAAQYALRQIDAKAPMDELTKEEISTIKRAVKNESGWADLKRSGVNAVGAGGTRQQLDQLIEQLRQINIFVNWHGEIEAMVTVPGGLHGPAYVAAVLEMGDLAGNPNLAKVRELVALVVAG
jgi:hypothetical protein